MGKEVKEDGLITGAGGPRKGLKFVHKIDLYTSFMLLLHLYLAPVMFASLRTTFLYVSIPHEMLAYGPITINATDPTKRVKELLCNDQYSVFMDNYMTDEMVAFEQARSEAFEALPAVQEQISAIDDGEGRTFSEFGVSITALCHLLPPAYDWGGCITYGDLEEKCLQGECGTNPNRCFWRNTRIVAIASYGMFICYIPALLMTMGMVYDPPPAGFRLFLKPVFAATFYLLTGIFAFTGLFVVTIDAGKYSPEAMVAAYPDFSVNFDAGWQCFLFTALACTVFGLIFVYLTIFSPKYPREENRWTVRRRNFEKSLRNISERARRES